jgi:hypothetical protein
VVPVDSRNYCVRVVEGADVKSYPWVVHVRAFPSKRGTALVAKGSLNVRRRVIDFSVTFRELHSRLQKSHQGNDGRSGMLPTVFAMTVANIRRLARRFVTHFAAHASAGPFHNCSSPVSCGEVTHAD